MSAHLGTNIVHDGLVSLYDAKSFASYDYTENYVNFSTYEPTRWSNVFPTYATLTPGYTAPDGSPTAVRFSGIVGGSSLLRVTFNTVTTDGVDSWTFSFYARLISGSVGSATTDFGDISTNNYTSQLIQDEWVRISYTLVPPAGTETWVDLMNNLSRNYVVDFWGLQLERRDFVTPYTPTTGTPRPRSDQFRDLVSGQDMTIYGSTTQWQPEGHFFFENNITNYIEKTGYPMPTRTTTHNVWWRSAYAGGQQTPYTYHIGGNNEMLFITTVTSVDALTKGSNDGIAVSNMANQWQNFCRTSDRDTGEERYYLNGVQIGSRNYLPGTLYTSPGTLLIGQEPDGANFDVNQNLDGDFGYLAIYDNILTADQVRQNYEALRGRFGR